MSQEVFAAMSRSSFMSMRRLTTFGNGSFCGDPAVRIVGELEASLKKYPPIKVGPADPHVPPK